MLVKRADGWAAAGRTLPHESIYSGLPWKRSAGALASAPLLWDEVDESLDLRSFTIRTLPDRMAVLGADPLLSVLEERPDLVTALSRLAARLEG